MQNQIAVFNINFVFGGINMHESIVKAAQIVTMPITIALLAVISIIIPGISQEIITFIAVLIAAFVKKFANQ